MIVNKHLSLVQTDNKSRTIYKEDIPFRNTGFWLKNSENNSSLTKAESVFFCLLLFFSAFERLPFNEVTGLSGVFSSNGFFLLCLGLIVMVFSRGAIGNLSPLVKRFFSLTLLLILVDFGMAFYLTPIVGSLFGETPLSVCLTTLCWLLFHAVAIFYIHHCYSKINFHSLDRVFDIMLIFVLAVSLIQVGVIVGIPGFQAFYDFTNVGNWFNLSTYRYERLCGPASEPSGMSMVINMLCFPYAASKYITSHKWYYGLSLCVLVFIAYFTFSSTVYVSLAFCIMGFIVVVIMINGGRISKSVIAVVMIACTIVLSVSVLALNSDNLKDNEIYNSISTLLTKVNDSSNQSTAYRNSTVDNDIKIFHEYPLFGVGEGNQGFFYADNLGSSVLNSGSVEAMNSLSGAIGVVNGGSFLPSLISGFGIVGTLAYGAWLVSSVKQASRGKKRMGSYYYMYLMALAGSAPMCWIGIGFSGLPIVFFLVIGMPFLAERACCVNGGSK